MVRQLKLILATVAILFSGSAAFAQCSGQFTAGQLCANSGLSQGLPSGTNLTTLFDSLYGASAGTIIYRGPTSWQSLPGNIAGTQILSEDGSGVPAWLTVSGTGTVTSVGLSAPSEFTVSGSPVTSGGTLTFVEANETANTFAAGPSSGGAAPWAFRGLVIGDFPSIGANTVVGNGTGSGAVPTALAMPSCSGATNALIWTSSTGFGCNTITGTGTVQSIVIGTGLASTQSPLTTTGTMSLATIAADNILGNASGSTAAPAAVPVGSCSAAQNALTYNTSTHAFGCNLISGSGTVITGAAGQIGYYSGASNVISGNIDANISSGALTLGLDSTTIGQLILEGSSSGSVTLTPQAAAGTPTITFGTASGTPAVTASSPLAITSATGNIVITGAAGKVLAGSGPAFTATPTIGIASTTTGSLSFVGSTSGTVILSVADAAGSWTLKLPTAAGSSGEFLETDGSGNASWASPSGSGTVNSGTGGQLTYYASNGTTVSGNANANISSGALTLGTASSTIGQVVLEGSSSGAATITPQAVAGTPTLTLGTSSGTPAVTASAPLSIATATGNISITGVAGEVLAGSGPAFTRTPTLGASGTAGTLAFGNATSGTITLGTVTGALGSVTASLPANSGTIAELNLAQSFTAAQNIASASSTAFSVGLNGSTNPAFNVDASTALQAAGLDVVGAATGGTVAIKAIDSGSNTNLTINAKGTGTIGIGSVSTGAVTITPATVFGAGITAASLATPSSNIAGSLCQTSGGVFLYNSGGNCFSSGTGTVTSATVSAGTGISVSGTCTITTSGTCTVANTGFVTAASKSDEQTGTSSTVATTPSQQQQHDSAAKMWASITGSSGAIQASYNVSGVVKNSTGNYTISFTTSFANTNYAVQVASESTAGGSGQCLFSGVTTSGRATGSVKVVFSNSAFAVCDPTSAFVVAYGRQ